MAHTKDGQVGYEINDICKETVILMRLNASSFEILRDKEQPTSKSKEPLLIGYVGIDDDNSTAFEALKELTSKEAIDKIVIVYHDYAFSLMGVSFTKSNANPPTVTFETTYKFRAKDIQLEKLSEF
jgi:hypothetical protein